MRVDFKCDFTFADEVRIGFVPETGNDEIMLEFLMDKHFLHRSGCDDEVGYITVKAYPVLSVPQLQKLATKPGRRYYKWSPEHRKNFALAMARKKAAKKRGK